MFVLALIIAAFLALIPANIAKSKGRSFGAWWFYGWMLFIVALIHSLLLKNPEEEAFKEQQKQFMESVVSGNNVGLKANGRTARKIDISANATPESLMKRAFIFLEDGDWDSAYAYCEAVLDADPECAEAYLGKLMAEYEVSEKSGLMNCAEPFTENDNYKKIVRFGKDELVDEISGYIEYIRNRNENAANEKLYAEAEYAFNSASSENDFKNAAERFRLLSGYKDSDEFYEKCIEKANEERIKEEQKAEEARIEAERKAEADRIAAEIQKKKNKKIAAIVLPIIAVIVVAVVVFTTVIQPMMEYNAAVSLMEEGKYEEAIIAFEAMDGYKDSAEQIVNCENAILEHKYPSAVALMEEGKYEEAITAFEAMEGYKDSDEKIIEIKTTAIYKADIGDVVYFGNYHDEDEWLVLDKQGTQLLIISKKALDCKPYNTTSKDVTWETCSLRKWLNNEFIEEAFSTEEQEMIVTTKLSNPDSLKGAKGGNDTEDKVFLLSNAEAEKYFSSNSERKCEKSDYAKNQGAITSWWLRSPGSHQNSAEIITASGTLDKSGNRVERENVAVRPAMWIDLSAIS